MTSLPGLNLGLKDKAVFVIDHFRSQRTIGIDQSPIENVLDHCTVGLRKTVELHGGWAGIERDEESDCNFKLDVDRDWVNADHLHGKGELNAVVLSAAGSTDILFTDYVDSLRRHAWAWILECGDIDKAEIRGFLTTKMDQAFGNIRERIESDLLLMRDVIDASLNEGADFHVDASCLQSFLDDSDLMEGFLEESERRNKEKVVKNIVELLDDDEKSELQNHLLACLGTDDKDALRTELLNAMNGEDGILLPAVVKKKRKPRKKNDFAHKRISRAYKLIESLGFGDLLRKFVDGSTVRLICKNELIVKLRLCEGKGRGVVAKSRNLENWTVPFDLNVETPDGKHLGGLCVYMEGTPILDMFLGVILHVESGSERELFDKANWFGMGDIKLTQSVIQSNYGELLGNLKTLQVVEPHSEEMSFHRAKPFVLKEWMNMRPLMEATSEWAWSDEIKSVGSDTSSNTLVSNSWLDDRNSLYKEFTFDKDRLGKVNLEIEESIAQWFSRAIKRWSDVRSSMEKLYVEHQLPQTPIGWNAGMARVFCGEIANTENIGSCVAEEEQLISG